MSVEINSIYVINLPARQERLEAFQRRFREHSDRDVIVQAGVALRNPNLGCLLSHQAILDQAVGPTLIFEDDAVFADDFTLSLSAPDDWEILWLGGQHFAPPRYVDDTWDRPTKVMRTHAYLVKQPERVGQGLRISGAPRMDPYIGRLAIPQYSLRHFTVGQSAGLSDITRRIRPAHEFWNRNSA